MSGVILGLQAAPLRSTPLSSMRSPISLKAVGLFQNRAYCDEAEAIIRTGFVRTGGWNNASDFILDYRNIKINHSAEEPNSYWLVKSRAVLMIMMCWVDVPHWKPDIANWPWPQSSQGTGTYITCFSLEGTMRRYRLLSTIRAFHWLTCHI